MLYTRRKRPHPVPAAANATGRARLAALLFAVAGVLGGCAGSDRGVAAGASADMAVSGPQGTFLAYEHDVRVELDAAQVAGRLKQLTDACQAARFGECAVLQVGQEGGDVPSASIQVRIAPKGVEPFIALAGDAGRVASRNARAEDLAQQVADTGLTQARLRKEHQTLSAYQQRPNLAVADLLAVSQRMAEIEAGLEQADRDAAQQRRRIDTQLISVQLQTPAGQGGRSEIREALREFGSVFTSSVAFVIKAVAALLPVAVVVCVIGWVLLRLWRRRRRAKAL